MGIFSRVKGLFQRKRITSADIYKEIFQTLESKTGIAVTWRTALQAVTFMAAARVIAEGLAQVPCKVFRKSANQRLPAEDHQLYGLLHDSPNEWMSSFEFFEMMGLHLVFCGNFFAFKSLNKGEVTELLPYEPQQVTVIRNGWDLSYKVMMAEGKWEPVPAANMWHVRGPSWNSWMGLEGVKLAREAIGLALATEEHGARLFRNGARIAGLLSTDQALTKEKALEMRDSWMEQHAGLEKSGSIAVVWGGLKYQALAMLNDAAQYIETRRFQVEEICRALRVMPIMVGFTDKTATYASAEQMFLAHVVHTMGPWYRRIETSANKNLLSERDRMEGYYIKFVTNALMRSAAKDRAEYYAKALGAGGAPAWMTQDEVRQLEELNPMGGSAAELPVPTNVGAPPQREGEENE